MILLLIWLLGVPIALFISDKKLKEERPFLSKEDKDFAKSLCFLSWIWIIYLLSEK